MSTFIDVEVQCPHCGVQAQRTVASSLNGPRVPDIVQAILAGRFQAFICQGCYGEYVVDRPLVYLDFDRGHWLHMFAADDEAHWVACTDEADRTFQNTMITWAPDMVRRAAEHMVRRTVFGLGALREKLALFEAGLDDVAVEVVKLQLARDEAFGLEPLGDARRARVVQVVGELVKIEHDGHGVAIPLEVLRDAASDPAFEALRVELASRSFVDVARFA